MPTRDSLLPLLRSGRGEREGRLRPTPSLPTPGMLGEGSTSSIHSASSSPARAQGKEAERRRSSCGRIALGVVFSREPFRHPERSRRTSCPQATFIRRSSGQRGRNGQKLGLIDATGSSGRPGLRSQARGRKSPVGTKYDAARIQSRRDVRRSAPRQPRATTFAPFSSMNLTCHRKPAGDGCLAARRPHSCPPPHGGTETRSAFSPKRETKPRATPHRRLSTTYPAPVAHRPPSQ